MDKKAFPALSAACMRFMFGKTSSASRLFFSVSSYAQHDMPTFTSFSTKEYI